MGMNRNGAWSHRSDPENPTIGSARRQYDQHRSSRKNTGARPLVLRTRNTKGILIHLRIVNSALPEFPRPRTRADCSAIPRPCPYVSCIHNLYLDVNPRTGSIKLNFPDLDPDQMSSSCTLDIADSGGTELARIADLMNITRERARQLEHNALSALRRDPDLRKARDDD